MSQDAVQSYGCLSQISPGYQVPFCSKLRAASEMLTGTVGLITDPKQANQIITAGEADLIFIAREFLRNPYWALRAEKELGREPDWALPYGYAVRRL